MSNQRPPRVMHGLHKVLSLAAANQPQQRQEVMMAGPAEIMKLANEIAAELAQARGKLGRVQYVIDVFTEQMQNSDLPPDDPLMQAASGMLAAFQDAIDAQVNTQGANDGTNAQADAGSSSPG